MTRRDPPAPPLTSLHVRRARRGDAGSLAWVVERFTPLLLAQARYRLRGPLGRACEPEDLVQDVWAVALPALPTLEPREGREAPVVLRFLATTLLNRANELARRALRRGPPASAPAPDALPAETRGAFSRVERDEACALLVAAIDELEGLDRDVLVLRAIEQHANHEVAALLGATPNAVSQRYRRVLADLRRRLPGSLLDEVEDDPPA